MISSLVEFSSQIKKKIPSLCLVIAKEREAAHLVLEHFEGKVYEFDGKDFDPSFFFSCVNNLSLFDDKILCHIAQADYLEKKLIEKYLSHPNEKVALLLSAESACFVKEVSAKGGLVLQLAEEKSWQKKKRLENFLKEKAKESSLKFSDPAIALLLEYVGLEKEMLASEFEKLALYALHKKEIGVEDVKELVAPTSLPTLWELSEALFAHDIPLTLKRAESLLTNNSLFTLLSHLRTQIKTLNEMFLSHEKGELAQKYPYLKGSILSKKIQEIHNNPPPLLKKAISLLFEAELTAKSGQNDPMLILEVFLNRLFLAN